MSASSPSKRPLITGMGAALVDLFADVDDATLENLGSPKGSMTLVDPPRAAELSAGVDIHTHRPGGSAANTVAGLAGLGMAGGFIGKVGDDAHDLIKTIRDSSGCGVLMISHDLHIVMADTDTVLCLNGHICCSGSPDTVVTNPEYVKLFGSHAAGQLAVYQHDHDHIHLPDGTVQHADGSISDHCHPALIFSTLGSSVFSDTLPFLRTLSKAITPFSLKRVFHFLLSWM